MRKTQKRHTKQFFKTISRRFRLVEPDIVCHCEIDFGTQQVLYHCQLADTIRQVQTMTDAQRTIIHLLDVEIIRQAREYNVPTRDVRLTYRSGSRVLTNAGNAVLEACVESEQPFPTPDNLSDSLSAATLCRIFCPNTPPLDVLKSGW